MVSEWGFWAFWWSTGEEEIKFSFFNYNSRYMQYAMQLKSPEQLLIWYYFALRESGFLDVF